MSFGVGDASEESLPFAVAVRGRVGHHEEGQAVVAAHGLRVLRGLDLQQEATVTRFVEEAIRRAGLLAEPPPDHRSWKPLADTDAADSGKKEL